MEKLQKWTIMQQRWLVIY